MEKENAKQLIIESKGFLGMEKPVVIESQLGLPSIVGACKFDGIIINEVKGEFFPKARMILVEDHTLVYYEDLDITLEFLSR